MYEQFLKRIMDIVLVIIITVQLLVVGLLFSLLIKIDTKGSIFFRQKRLGENGKEFEIYKLRTMVENAERTGTGIFTSKRDTRITKVGKFLRKTSLDELPQINVFKGEMSLIGPRPPVPHHPYLYKDYTKIQKKRFKVKPGITGLAQATGRNQLTWDERIVYDVKYVENLTLLLDVKIIYKTFISIVFSKGVYSKK